MMENFPRLCWKFSIKAFCVSRVISWANRNLNSKKQFEAFLPLGEYFWVFWQNVFSRGPKTAVCISRRIFWRKTFWWTNRGKIIADRLRNQFPTNKDIMMGILIILKITGLERQRVMEASRSLLWRLLSHNRSFCLRDLLLVLASVWQRLHLRSITLQEIKVLKWCDFEKKLLLDKKQVCQESTCCGMKRGQKITFKVVISIRVVEKATHKKTKLKIFLTGHPATTSFIFTFDFC